MRSMRRGLRVRNVSTAVSHGSSVTKASSGDDEGDGEREGGRFEAAVAALEGTQDIRLQGSVVTIVSSCAAPPGDARRQPSRSRRRRYPRLAPGSEVRS